jgi:hypothetical protein
MAERNSEFERQPADAYWTPQWVFDALFAVEKFDHPWDCAPRNADFDFLQVFDNFHHIVTNPPYSLAEKFCRHAIDMTNGLNGKVGMLLPIAFDAAKTRRHLFAECHQFKSKLTLTRRIRWENLEQRAAGPSMNHAWFVWDWKHDGKPTMGWLR